jgi:isopentenyl diphosphate isomerase/L-lactate dehydrogenase-like FMN-dependent dehydrogenase
MRQSRRLPPPYELVNAFEFEDVAKLTLTPEVYSTIAGSDRTAFDRMTLRPRMCIPVLDMDLTVELLGDAHFTPILVGPVADQRRYHRDGELATIRGAAAAKTSVIASDRSSVPIADIAHEAKTPLWYSVSAAAGATARTQAGAAVSAGCRVVCITTGARIDWRAVDRIRGGINARIVLKGVTSGADARTAVERGIHGIIVSNDDASDRSASAPITALPSVVESVAGKAVVMVGGNFRRGSDILKALILGAQGVLVARPVMWALAGYGADGVQTLLELLQSDLGRHIGALGVSTIRGLTRNHLRIHSR